MSVWAIADLHLSFARPEGDERHRRRALARPRRSDRARVARGGPSRRPGAAAGRPVDGPQPSRPPARPRLARSPPWHQGPRPGQPRCLVERRRPGPADAPRLANWPSAATPSPRAARSSAAPSGADVRRRKRGSTSPPTRRARPSDRELATPLDRALEAAAAPSPERQTSPLFVLWHYPPFDQHRRPGPCVPRFERAGVTACVYGHLHAKGQWSLAVQGTIHGVHYACVAADAIGFRPLRVDPRHP